METLFNPYRGSYYYTDSPHKSLPPTEGMDETMLNMPTNMHISAATYNSIDHLVGHPLGLSVILTDVNSTSGEVMPSKLTTFKRRSWEEAPSSDPVIMKPIKRNINMVSHDSQAGDNPQVEHILNLQHIQAPNHSTDPLILPISTGHMKPHIGGLLAMPDMEGGPEVVSHNLAKLTPPIDEENSKGMLAIFHNDESIFRERLDCSDYPNYFLDNDITSKHPRRIPSSFIRPNVNISSDSQGLESTTSVVTNLSIKPSVESNNHISLPACSGVVLHALSKKKSKTSCSPHVAVEEGQTVFGKHNPGSGLQGYSSWASMRAGDTIHAGVESAVGCIPYVNVGNSVIRATAEYMNSVKINGEISGCNYYCKPANDAHEKISISNADKNHSVAESKKRPFDQTSAAHNSTISRRAHLQGHASKSELSSSKSVCGSSIRTAKSSSPNPLGPALNTNLKPRARQGTANDPQAISARNRRERINARLKTLQELVPNGSKVDLVTMLEKAVNYVKFLQLQLRVLSNDEYWSGNQAISNGVMASKSDENATLIAAYCNDSVTSCDHNYISKSEGESSVCGTVTFQDCTGPMIH